MANPNVEELKKVIVLGAGKGTLCVLSYWSYIHITGVVGLTTAVKIQEHGGYQVTIISEVLPTDAKTIKYTSHWAVSLDINGAIYIYINPTLYQGAHHVLNVTEDERQQSATELHFTIF
jgi:hypothetical protein